MACEEEKCLECGMHRDRGTCHWCKREKALEELKVMLVRYKTTLSNAATKEALETVAAMDLVLLLMIEKIVEILEEK